MSPNWVLCDVKNLIDPDAHLLQTQVYCCAVINIDTTLNNNCFNHVSLTIHHIEKWLE
jgi:hypothetical protein